MMNQFKIQWNYLLPKFRCRCGSSNVKLSGILIYFCFEWGLTFPWLIGRPDPVLNNSSNVSKSISYKNTISIDYQMKKKILL